MLSSVIRKCAVVATTLVAAGCHEIRLTLRAEVPDGTTALARVDFEDRTLGQATDGCFASGRCEMTLGPSDIDGERDVELTAWADPEGDDMDRSGLVSEDLWPESGEPQAARIVDIPKLGILEITLDLE